MENILILPGDGIGPEVMGEVRRVIDWFGTQRDRCDEQQKWRKRW